MTAVQNPPAELTESAKTLIAGSVALFVRTAPGTAARNLVRLDRVESRLDAYDRFRRDEIRRQLAAAERCGICGRRLRDPDSVARGIGPECLDRMERGRG